MNCTFFNVFYCMHPILGTWVTHDFMLWCRIRGGLGLVLGWTLDTGHNSSLNYKYRGPHQPSTPSHYRHNCGHSHRVIKWGKWWRRNRIRPPTHPAIYSMLSSILHPVWWRMAKSIADKIFCWFSTLLQATDTDSLFIYLRIKNCIIKQQRWTLCLGCVWCN